MGYTQHGNDLNLLHELYSIGVQQLRKSHIKVLHQIHPSISLLYLHRRWFICHITKRDWLEGFVDIKLIESLFPFDWTGWKTQGYAHHSPSYLTGAGVLLCVFRLCYLYMVYLTRQSWCWHRVKLTFRLHFMLRLGRYWVQKVRNVLSYRRLGMRWVLGGQECVEL
jgi:hypothetical protein